MPNPITMLKADHAMVRRLLRELNESGSRAVKERERLVREIERELKTHAQIEEELFLKTSVIQRGWRAIKRAARKVA
jgi:hypothetical protein